MDVFLFAWIRNTIHITFKVRSAETIYYLYLFSMLALIKIALYSLIMFRY